MKEIELTPPQSKFIKNTAKFPLFVAGFGSGKSLTMAVSILNDASLPTNIPIKIGAYAPTYDLIKLVTIPYLCEFLEEMGIRFKLNKQDYLITLEHGDKIYLRSLNNPDRIVGYQTLRGHIDEADTLTEINAVNAWNKIVARNRQVVPIVDLDGNPLLHEEDDYYGPDDKKIKVASVGDVRTHLNRVSAYTTPEGYKFAYKTWEKNPKYGYEMVRASSRSNPYNNSDYIQQLYDTYPEQLIEAYVEGHFVNLLGKTVYPKFRRETHHVDIRVEPHDILEVGMDFNVVHGAAVINIIRDGHPVAVDEIHQAYDTDEQTAILKERYPNQVINVYPDATGSRRTSANTVESDIAKLRAAGFNVFCDYTNPPIKDRVMSLNAMISNGKGLYRYKVNTNTCPNFTEALEQQVWGDNGLPDKSNGLDHINDAAGYYIFNKFGITKPTAKTFVSSTGY